MHRGGSPDLTDLQWSARSWNGAQAYSDSKLDRCAGLTGTPLPGL
jgi:hypothetical protein